MIVEILRYDEIHMLRDQIGVAILSLLYRDLYLMVGKWVAGRWLVSPRRCVLGKERWGWRSLEGLERGLRHRLLLTLLGV
jgi:hypothetical protein